MWRLWAKALGEKATKNDKEADYAVEIDEDVQTITFEFRFGVAT